MNHFVVRTLVSLLFGALALGSAQAQRTERIIKASIPFEFSVGRQTFPAGTYSLVITSPVFLQVRDCAGHTLATVLTNSVEANPAASPKLRFTSEGGHYTLAQVWQGDDSGEQLPSPRPSTKLAKRQSRHAQTVASSLQ